MKTIIQFLARLSRHNEREWFQAHKAEYQEAQAKFNNFTDQLIKGLAQFDPTVGNLTAKDCTYRIYRDTRFSEDKTPYKTHFGGYINAKGKKSNHCGYYIHVEPDNCMLAGGSYCLPSPVLRAVRQAVYDNIDEFRSIVEDPAFSRYFPVIGENFLKGAPKGFPKTFPYLKYLQCKEYTVACHVPDRFFLQPGFADQAEDIFRQLKRYADFLNYTIDDFE